MGFRTARHPPRRQEHVRPGGIALRSHGPVLISALRAEPLDSWTPFSAEAERLGVHSVHAVPLQIGAVGMGRLTLHSTSSIRADAGLTRRVLTRADVLRIALLSPRKADGDVSRWGDVLLSAGHIVTTRRPALWWSRFEGLWRTLRRRSTLAPSVPVNQYGK